jgi:hypothetical protein
VGCTTRIISNFKQIIMGATWFETRHSGKTLQNAYKSACDMAEDEYGHQEGYNGTISTTHGVRDVTENYNKSKFDSIEQYIHSQLEVLGKRDCHAICIRKPIENKNKTKSQVEHIVTPGTKKWILKYTVRHGDRFIGSWNTKGDAVKDARRYTENNQVATTIEMEKVLDKGSNRVAIIKYKKATTERDGEWIFFGWAAE